MTPSEDDIRFMREAAESTLEKMRRAGIKLPRPELAPLNWPGNFTLDAALKGASGYVVKGTTVERVTVTDVREPEQPYYRNGSRATGTKCESVKSRFKKRKLK